MTTAAVDNDDNGIADDLNNNGFEDSYPGFQPGGGCPSSCTPDASPTFYDDTPTTAPLAPLNAAGNGNDALWGGLVILGRAPTNLADKCGEGYGLCTIEGLTIPGFPAADALYGGTEPHDSSGIYRYLSVRYAGDEIGDGNELNGVSLGGVGDGTVFEYIEVYVNYDDGIEWFGGTVNGNHLMVSFVGDDMFDLDQGYTGTNQFLFGIMPFFNETDGSAYGYLSGDKIGEWDGDDFLERSGDLNIRVDEAGATFDDTSWPLAGPAMYNMTLIGTTLPGSPDFDPSSNSQSTASANTGVQMRHGFAGEILNSVVINTGSNAGLVLDMDSGESAADSDVTDNVSADRIRSVACTYADGASPTGGAAALAISNGDAAVPEEYNDSGTANVVNSGSFAGLENEDVSFNPKGNGSGKLASGLKSAPIDPRVDTSSTAGVGGGVTTGPDPGATYRGAFQQSVPLWTDGWTTLDMGGLL
jgi:hypothetical protein